jgi:hypothetical protein
MNDENYKPFLFSKFIFRLFFVISLVVFYKTIEAYNFRATQMSGIGTVFIISFLNPFLGLIAGYLLLLPSMIYRKFKKLPQLPILQLSILYAQPNFFT